MLQKKHLFLWDVGLCAIIALHILVAFILSRFAGGNQWFNVFPSGTAFLIVALIYLSVCLPYAIIRAAITRSVRESFSAFFNARVASGLIVFYAIGLMMGAFHSIKIMMPEFVPFTWDERFADLDHLIHGRDPWLFLRVFEPFHHQISIVYMNVWMLLNLFATFSICIANVRFRLRYLYSYVTTWIVCGNIIPLMFMAVGPIFYERLTGDDRFAVLSRRIFEITPKPSIPDILWQSYVDKTPFIGSGISAFPSLHVAMAMLLFLAALSVNRVLGGLAGAFLVFTLLASVHLGWHYAVDGYASIILVAGIWWFWGRVTKGASRSIHSTS